MAEILRRRVREETNLTCSVGVAPNRALAKVSHWRQNKLSTCAGMACGLNAKCCHHRMQALEYSNVLSLAIAHDKAPMQVCADRNKPDGQFVLAPDVDAIMDFVATLPIRKVCGIGKVRC